jgi:hypothetical protein
MNFGVSGHRFGLPSTTLLKTQPHGSDSPRWLLKEE